MNETVEPVEVDRGNLIPKTYGGDLRTFVLTDGEQVWAEGARFSDGRCVVARPGGEVMERYASEGVMVREVTRDPDFAERGVFRWCAQSELCSPALRRFVFVRHTDPSNFSGPGVALEGVRFTHGGVVLMWLGEINSLVEWPSIELAVTTHGHAGDTVLRWLDGDDAAA